MSCEATPLTPERPTGTRSQKLRMTDTEARGLVTTRTFREEGSELVPNLDSTPRIRPLPWGEVNGSGTARLCQASSLWGWGQEPFGVDPATRISRRPHSAGDRPHSGISFITCLRPRSDAGRKGRDSSWDGPLAGQSLMRAELPQRDLFNSANDHTRALWRASAGRPASARTAGLGPNSTRLTSAAEGRARVE